MKGRQRNSVPKGKKTKFTKIMKHPFDPDVGKLYGVTILRPVVPHHGGEKGGS